MVSRGGWIEFVFYLVFLIRIGELVRANLLANVYAVRAFSVSGTAT